MSFNSLETSLRELGIEFDSLAPHPMNPAIAIFKCAGGDVAVGAWRKIRNALGSKGYWPIICGDPKDFERYASDGIQVDSATTLSNVPTGRPVDSLEKYDDFEEDFGEGEESSADDDWPSTSPIQGRRIASAFSLTKGKPLPECIIALIPTEDPSEAPAHVAFGGYNECPEAAVHVAFLRDWAKRYRAAPIAMTGDVLECIVEAPPMTEAAAKELAQEFYQYCPDIVDQGTETVTRLAYEIWQSPYWFFWWD